MLKTWLLEGLMQGTLLAALAWLCSVTVLRQARPSTHAAMWTLVLVKFLIPFGPHLSLPAVAARTSLTIGAPRFSSEEPATLISFTPFLLAAWAFLLVRKVRAHLRLLRSVCALPDASTALIHHVHQLAERLGAPKPMVRRGSTGPCVVGLWNPTLILPAHVEGLKLDAMLTHELAHLKRRDAWWQLVQSLAETIFFFWPVVTLVTRRLSLSREQACDEAVVTSRAMPAADYAELLLHSRLSPDSGLAMAAPKSQLERRIDMLLNERARKSRWVVVAVLAVIGVGIAVKSKPALAAEPEAKKKPRPEVQVFPKGALDQEAFRDIAMLHVNEARECYEKWVGDPNEATTQLLLHFTVTPTGSVDNAYEVMGSTVDPAVTKCIIERVLWWQFPERAGGPVEVTYPFTFEPGC